MALLCKRLDRQMKSVGRLNTLQSICLTIKF